MQDHRYPAHPDAGYWILDAGIKKQEARSKMQDKKMVAGSVSVSGSQSQSGFGFCYVRYWMQDSGYQNARYRIQDTGYNLLF